MKARSLLMIVFVLSPRLPLHAQVLSLFETGSAEVTAISSSFEPASRNFPGVGGQVTFSLNLATISPRHGDQLPDDPAIAKYSVNNFTASDAGFYPPPIPASLQVGDTLLAAGNLNGFSVGPSPSFVWVLDNVSASNDLIFSGNRLLENLPGQLQGDSFVYFYSYEESIRFYRQIREIAFVFNDPSGRAFNGDSFDFNSLSLDEFSSAKIYAAQFFKGNGPYYQDTSAVNWSLQANVTQLGAIPEPTMARLSLLGLNAGVLSRRRRQTF